MSEDNKTQRPYAPRMLPDKEYEEINSYVVFWGLFFRSFSLWPSAICA